MTNQGNIQRNTALRLNTAKSDENQIVVFRLSEEEFGVEIENVKEIVRLPDITPIPRSPDYVAGICNLRGNVLPVIDTRSRFSMESHKATDHTRLLVVESNGVQTSLIVDSVREVMRMQDVQEEPPPAVCRGIDRQFLSGVVKVDEGERLILKLNLNEVLFIELEKSAVTSEISDSRVEALMAREEDMTDEAQLVTFKVAGDEYAFSIDKVNEIIKINEITAVPNVPGYVKGLFTIRNQLLPIIDLRELLGLPSLISEHYNVIDDAIERHRKWMENLRHVVEAGTHFTGSLDAKKTSFGIWLENYKTSSIEVESIIKRLKKSRWELFNAASEALELRAARSQKKAAISFLTQEMQPMLEIVIDIMGELRNTLEHHILEDQRALFIKTDTMNIGYLVDWVDEVVRIPNSVIDEAPALASSERKELKAVAKLDQGERLIMIVDENALVSQETSRLLSEIKRKKEDTLDKEDTSEDKKTLAQQRTDEEQLVTFIINNEEYGIRIMKVQEINRASEITAVPRAPYFVDGMTNLRGDILPVVNIRKLFRMEDREIDDRTRIIVVEMGGNKTGLRVDRVNEVLRLSKRNIVKTPKVVVSSGVNAYMEGVCKLDSGKRIVVLLDVEKILDEKELRSLSEITEKAEFHGTDVTEESPEEEAEEVQTELEKAKEPSEKKKLEIAE